MSSTYSILKFELPGNGEQSGTWGNTTNTNIGTAIEQAIVGMATLDSGDFTANVCTLTLANTNAAQDARALCLNIASGAVSAAGTVNVPAIQKPYIVINGSSFTVTVKVSGQTGVAVPAGKRTVVYNNGTDVGSQIDWLGALDITTINATTVDATNIEATNLKAKDGTAGMQIANSTGVVSFTANPVLSGGTANGVAYLNGSKVLTTGTGLTFNGTNVMGLGATVQAWSASARALQVGSAASFATSHNGVTIVSHNTYESAAAVFNYVASVGAQQYLQSAAGGHSWQTAPAGTAGDVVPFTTRMSLSTAGALQVTGSIGINAAPVTALDVRGSLNSLQARFGNVNTRGLEISTALTGGTNDATTILNALGAGSGNLVLQTDSTERLRINQLGYVGIGTSAPGHILDIRNDADGSVYTRISNQNVGSSSLAGLYIQGQGNEFYIRNYGDGTATPNRTDFYSGAGSSYFTFSPSGAERMRITAAGNVVIGADSTTQPLEVVGQGVAFRTSQAASANSVLRVYGGAYTGNLATLATLTGTNTSNLVIIGGGTSGGEPATTIAFHTGTVGTAGSGTERMRLDNAGNLGLGVTPSAWQVSFPAVQIKNAGFFGVLGASYAGVSSNLYVSGASVTTTSVYITSAAAALYAQNAGNHVWYNAPSGTAGNTISFTQAMTLDTSGNLGIGTTSPTLAKLQIAQTSNTAGAIYAAAASGQNGNAFAFVITGVTNGYQITNDGSNNITHKWSGTGGIERVHIDPSGNVQVQTGAVVVYQPAPASISTTATLTNANIQARIINTTGTTYTVTMPLGTTLETLVPWTVTNLGYDFTVINTASGTITMAVNTGVTALGALTIATGTSANFRIRRTAANTFVLYRLS